ncbi:hypothetical protein CEXT_688171 [Caerostris extrusa]|uniref:Uncharacterized protein n=1 Tax=Caerostris extrusa TaxID=172846 RepID=A0AAV4UY08_CAEEX|nr:hypothetical protein CEXT_688171 [Caerostris extrusa]
MFILVALSCLAVAQASGFYEVYPQFVPSYERAVGNYGYSDFRGFPYNYGGGLLLHPWLLLQPWFASPSVVYGGLGPYGLRSGYNGYGLGYNGFGYRGVLGYSGLLGGYGGVIGFANRRPVSDCSS